MSSVKISELAAITTINANTANTLLMGVDIPTGVTGKFTAHTLAQGLYSNEVLNRPKLAEFIFNDPSLREKVNHIVHPRVREEFDSFVLRNSSPLIFNEAAILFETGAFKQFDATILITCPKSLRIERLMARDNSLQEEIEARMNAQWSDDQKQDLADYIIVNDEINPLLVQIEKVILDLLN